MDNIEPLPDFFEEKDTYFFGEFFYNKLPSFLHPKQLRRSYRCPGCNGSANF